MFLSLSVPNVFCLSPSPPPSPFLPPFLSLSVSLSLSRVCIWPGGEGKRGREKTRRGGEAANQAIA